MKIVNWIIAFINYYLAGFVLMKVWNWFPHEIFNITTINYAQALGLNLLIMFFRNFNVDSKKNKERTDEENMTDYTIMTCVYGVMLLFGVVIHAFMS